RTGKLFAMEHYGVVADITTMAKGLGGGFPIAAVTGRAEIMDAPGPGGLGGTYGGNPIGIAAGNAVLDIIEEEGLNDRAEQLGARLKQRLQSLVDAVPQIADIRGPGFMNAVEFNIPGTHQPNADFTNKVRALALEKGLILLTCGVYGNVIRFLSPLTIQDEVFAEALDILEDTLRECAKEA
ncbi:aminotransferase class III-fold pyridoxal phosphate-dependent enzyme, partial [Rhizobium sp.]|uniref:aminotransferase class III-fold pyridoxal phosphate-dependent enzyme n=1 Tax=Rhizobium sp. TaxID=391 RepID=UPI000E9A7A85|nr:4-aminobutyrate--2-oxoglutarate transaminase [Rhizobium sp.]